MENKKELLELFKKQKEELDDLCNKRSLSDDFLKQSGRDVTRKEIGIGGEFPYGIVMVVDDVAYLWLNTAIELLKQN